MTVCVKHVVNEYLGAGDFLPLFKCSDHTNYSVEAFNLLFEYHTKNETANDVGTYSYVHSKQGRNVSMDLHMEHINKECKQTMGSLGSNIGEKAVGQIGRSNGEVMKVTQNFGSVNKVHDESGHHPMRTVQLDMEKLLAQANMIRKLHVSTLSKWMKEQVHKYKIETTTQSYVLPFHTLLLLQGLSVCNLQSKICSVC